MALAGLLLWPTAETETTQAEAPLFGPWPSRGPLVDDAALLDSAEDAWRSAAASGLVDPPGRDVRPLYIGVPDGPTVAALTSVAPNGQEVVAMLTDGGSGWRVLDAASRSTTDPVPGLALPSEGTPRILLSPELALSQARPVVRRDDAVWTPLPVDEDGVTAPVPTGFDGSEPTIGIKLRREESDDRGGLSGVFSVSPWAVYPLAPPVILDDPLWGRGDVALTTSEYDAAVYAEPVVPEGNGRMAVLAHAQAPGGRVVMVQAQSATAGWYSHMLVVPGEDGAPTLGPAPVVEADLAAGAGPRAGGRVQVLAAAAPEVSGLEIRDPGGNVLIEAAGSTSVVLAPPLPREVRVLGKDVDGAVTATLVLPLAAQAEAGAQ